MRAFLFYLITIPYFLVLTATFLLLSVVFFPAIYAYRYVLDIVDASVKIVGAIVARDGTKVEREYRELHLRLKDPSRSFGAFMERRAQQLVRSRPDRSERVWVVDYNDW